MNNNPYIRAFTIDNQDCGYSHGLFLNVGEVEYKFSIDNQSVEESFVPGSACTKTTGEYTNRITAVEASSTLEAVCFNSCTTCE